MEIWVACLLLPASALLSVQLFTPLACFYLRDALSVDASPSQAPMSGSSVFCARFHSFIVHHANHLDACLISQSQFSSLTLLAHSHRRKTNM
jgi:hypothetical protein